MPRWSSWLPRSRGVLRGPSPNALTPVQPAEVSSAAAALVTPAARKDDPAVGRPKARGDDRTTRIYNRPSFETLKAYVAGKEWTSDEVTKTARLSSEDIDELLLQLQRQARDDNQVPAASVAGAAASEIEVKVNSITLEELEEFRRSLASGYPEVSDTGLSLGAEVTRIFAGRAAPLAGHKSLLVGPSSTSTARRLLSRMVATARWLVVLAVSAVAFAWRSRLVQRAAGAVFSRRLVRPAQPPLASDSRKETSRNISVSK